MRSSAGLGVDHLPHAGASHGPAIERLISAMRERVDDTLPLHAMAEIVHLSPYHFARVFRQVTGIPPGEFLSALRLERAKQLLLTTDLSVTEICFEVGYGSLGTFTSRFTRLVGLPPGRMRRPPEELVLVFEHLRERYPDPTAPPGIDVAFQIGGPDLAGALIFVGLFLGAIPQRRPVAGMSWPRQAPTGWRRCPTAATTSWPPPCLAPKIPPYNCCPATRCAWLVPGVARGVRWPDQRAGGRDAAPVASHRPAGPGLPPRAPHREVRSRWAATKSKIEEIPAGRPMYP